jgi:hypothetical protein
MDSQIINSISQKGLVTYRQAQQSDNEGAGAPMDRGHCQRYDRPAREEIQVIDITTI